MPVNSSTSKRLTYQPFLFAISLLALLTKAGYSISRGKDISDSVLWVFVVVFLVSSFTWYLDSRNQKPKVKRTIDVNIEAGGAKKATITGVEARRVDQTKVGIKTKDLDKTNVTGYRER